MSFSGFCGTLISILPEFIKPEVVVRVKVRGGRNEIVKVE
jgi:hypothetical protein